MDQKEYNHQYYLNKTKRRRVDAEIRAIPSRQRCCYLCDWQGPVRVLKLIPVGSDEWVLCRNCIYIYRMRQKDEFMAKHWKMLVYERNG